MSTMALPHSRPGWLSGGDVLLAIDGLRVTADNIDKRLARYLPGDNIDVHAFRRDELMAFRLQVGAQPPPKFLLKADPKPPRHAAALRRRHAATLRRRWLGQAG